MAAASISASGRLLKFMRLRMPLFSIEKHFKIFARSESESDLRAFTALERLSKSAAPAESGFKYRLVKKTTLDRWQKATKRLTRQEGDQLVRLAKIWALAMDVWGDEVAARDFLFRPHLMLNDRLPVDVVLGTEIGAQLVDGILGRLKYGSAA